MLINIRDAFYREEERQQLQQKQKAKVKYATIIIDAYQERIANITSKEAKELQHTQAQEQSRL
jgi:vacuolar-type H+-ATPase subunit E/Vma4